MNTDKDGLSQEEVERKLEIYGRNELAHEKPPRWYIQLTKAFINPFTGILFFLLLYLILLTFFLLHLNTRLEYNYNYFCNHSNKWFLHFIQEYRSSIETEKLKAMIHTTAAVKRKGTDVKEINIEEIVPGDIVYLAAGDMIPADLRIISSKDLCKSGHFNW